MISVKDIRAITEASRNKQIIEAIEEGIKEAAYSGTNYKTFNIEVSRDLLHSIIEYFKSSGFMVDYESAGINPISGITVYTFKVWW